MTQPGRVLGAAAARRAGQRPAARRRRADRSGRPAGDAGTVAGHLDALAGDGAGLGAGLSGAGPPHRRPGDRRRPAAADGRGAAARRAGRPREPTRGSVDDDRAASHDPRPSWPRPAPPLTGRVGVVMTMGALHEGHAALMRAARARGRPRARHDLRQPAAVRAERGLRPLPAHPRGATSRSAAARRRRRRLRPAGGRDVPGRRAAGTGRSRARSATMLEGAQPARPLRRRADRRAQAAQPDPARPGRLRREGLPAADPDPPDGARPRPAGARSSACRPCASPTGWRCPAATATSPPPSGQTALALSRGAARPAPTAAEAGAAPMPSGRRAGGPRRARPRRRSTTSRSPTRTWPARRRRARPGCWWPPGSADTRLIDNMPLDLAVAG